jgi:signal transduction histidine kinase
MSGPMKSPSRENQPDPALEKAERELAELQTAVRAILDGLGQALLYFDDHGTCATVFSAACRTLLETDPAGKHIADVLKLSAVERDNLIPLLALCFNDEATAMPFAELMALAPQWYRHSKGLRVALSYRAMRDEKGRMTGIMVVATDITHKVETHEKLAQKEEQVLRTLRIAGNRGGYVRYLRSFEAAFKTLKSADSLADVLRDLHTLKAMAKVFYLSSVAGLLHEVEGALGRLDGGDWREQMAGVMASYQVRLELMLEYARWLGREIWGYEFEQGRDIIPVETGALRDFGIELERLLRGGARPEEVVALYFARVASVSVMDMLAFFETQVGYFAEATERQVRFVREKGDDVRIFPEFYGGFFDSLTHVARNILDHAYEPPAMREILGKLPELRVTYGARYTDASKKTFIIEIADDGQGISPAEVRERLAEMSQAGRTPRTVAEIAALPDAELIQHIFDAAFSTKDSVDANSGRGLGMNVVKAEAAKLGGTVRVESKHGFSTKLTITLPVLWQETRR